MYQAITVDGRVFRGDQIYWQDLPEDTVIKSLRCSMITPQNGVIANHELKDCDAYGFHRYDINTTRGVVGVGVQLLGRRGDIVVVVDIELHAGRTIVNALPVGECTYAKRLWRRGAKGVGT